MKLIKILDERDTAQKKAREWFENLNYEELSDEELEQITSLTHPKLLKAYPELKAKEWLVNFNSLSKEQADKIEAGVEPETIIEDWQYMQNPNK